MPKVYLLVAFAYAALQVYFGLGLALVLTPNRLRKYSIVFSPVLGYAYASLCGWYFYVSGWRGTDSYAHWIFVPPVLFLALAYLKCRPAKLPHFHPAVIAILGIAIVGFLIVSIPVLRSGQLTSTTIGNDDVADLATVSTFLKEHSRDDISGFLGQSTIIRSLADHEFFSPTLSTAIAGTVLGLETYRLQTLSMNVFFFFSVLLFYALAEGVFRYTPWDAVVASGVYAVSPVMAYVVLQGYQGQVMGSAVAIALFILLANALEVTSASEMAVYLPILVLTTWALSMSYVSQYSWTRLVGDPMGYGLSAG